MFGNEMILFQPLSDFSETSQEKNHCNVTLGLANKSNYNELQGKIFGSKGSDQVT